ncbi:hypothetical protein PsYK624_079870 [Phanerochaete sordida]|uniref:Uncharacterized protein n=1 Tax=Phanerochaete sordida TaxID=48140 RepID=A0A9P3GBI1_9APHY|nr:hypothetical protein PsYK624_079870 [Phanerochaete sordida]
MPESQLSDEVLEEILAYCMTIPPDVFLQFPTEARDSPHEYLAQSRLDYLCVSKRWLRVARPLLYTSVVLFKNAHTKSVAAVLAGHSGVGRRMRTLRLEGGYGRDFALIAAAAPRIEHLYLNLEVASSDTIAGLRKSLTTLNPTTFRAHQLGLLGIKHGNQTVLELRAIMEACISSRWTNLTHIFLSESFPMSMSMAKCLVKAEKLEELHIATADALKWLSAEVDPAIPLATVLHNRTLQIVRCRGIADKEAVYSCLAVIPTLPPAMPLVMFVPKPGEPDEFGGYAPNPLEVATQQLVAQAPAPAIATAFNVRAMPQHQGYDSSGSHYRW